MYTNLADTIQITITNIDNVINVLVIMSLFPSQNNVNLLYNCFYEVIFYVTFLLFNAKYIEYLYLHE